MDRDSKILITGHTGLVGSALHRRLKFHGCTNLLLPEHADLDLRDQPAVRSFFEEQSPEIVFHAAARVGGILANSTYPGQFIYDNLMMEANVLHEAHRSGVRRLLFLGSSCIYPKHAPQPLKEEYLLTGPLEPTNRPYAVAKIAGIEMCWAYNRQYGTRFLAAMLTSIFGPGDSYHPANSHVIPAMIHKMHEAKKNGAAEVSVWGTGRPRREFLFSDDAADACFFLATLDDHTLDGILRADMQHPIINVGCGVDLTIRETAELIAQVVGFQGRIVFDATRPDGSPRKLLDISRLTTLGWKPTTSFLDGLSATYRSYCSQQILHHSS